MSHPRRQFLRHAVSLGLATTLVGGLGTLGSCGGRPGRKSPSDRLRPAIDATTGLTLLHLPAGFRYFTFAWAGEALPGGGRIPANADGMGVVATTGAAHKQTFDVECEISEYGRAERGIGGSRRAGEQAAAAAMLAYVKTLD